MLPNDEKSLRQLIAAAVEAGYRVSVWDGGEWPVMRSKDEAAVFDAASGVDEAKMNFWKCSAEHPKAWGLKAGTMLLVYGNDEETVVADHVVNPELEALYDASLVKMEE